MGADPNEKWNAGSENPERRSGPPAFFRSGTSAEFNTGMRALSMAARSRLGSLLWRLRVSRILLSE